MTVEISTSKYIILESGCVIVPEDDYVEFNIKGARFRFVFTQNETDSTDDCACVTGTLKKDTEGDYLEVDINNYKAMFSTPSQTLNVGTIDEKSLYVNFSTVPLADNSRIKCRIIIYSWYKEK